MEKNANYWVLGLTGLFLMFGCARNRQFVITPTVPLEKSLASNIVATGVESLSQVREPDSIKLASYAPSTASGLSEWNLDEPRATEANTTVEELVKLAIANNPSIRELAATTQKAAGFRTQVGLKPNPIMGYQASQLADRGTDQHVLFAEQEFVTANKLELNRQVLNESLRTQLFELESQRKRVETDVRVAFYQALAIQTQLLLIKEFQGVTESGYKLTKVRLKAGEASRVDLLQSQVQMNEVELVAKQKRVKLSAAWRGLAAVTGVAGLTPTQLNGKFDIDSMTQDWQSLESQLVGSSPEYAAAEANVSRARAELVRHGVQAIPNISDRKSVV